MRLACFGLGMPLRISRYTHPLDASWSLVVLGNDFFREYRQADSHLLVMPNGGVVVKILNVKIDEAGTGGGDGAVQNSFSLR